MQIKIGSRFVVEWTGDLFISGPWFGGKRWEAFWDRQGSSVSAFSPPFLPSDAPAREGAGDGL